MNQQFIYVDKREQVSKVDGAAYYTVFKLERELTEDETRLLSISKTIPEIPGMRLPKAVKVSEYPAYVKKHEDRGDKMIEL